MKKIALLFFLCFFGRAHAQCVVPVSYSLTYQSTDGAGNCTFKFTPVVTINQSGASVKLVQYKFTVGSTVVTVCYTGTPVVLADCNGTFSALPNGANQTLPTATIVLPCSSGSLVLTGSTSTQGNSTCTETTIYTGPLPVKLLSFEGVSKMEGISLNWATEWETNNEGFQVQKSTNAKSFEGIGFVPGQKNTNLVSTYEFLDKEVETGQTYYYRLNQKDAGGASELSRIIAVRHTGSGELPIKVYPNATTGGAFMLSMLDAQSATVQFYNEAGREIPVSIAKTGDPNIVSVTAGTTLAKGIYLLQISSAKVAGKQSVKVLVE